MSRLPVRVCGPRDRAPAGVIVVNTTSRGGDWAGLSPFHLGPVKLYDGHVAERMENGWQYAKVYPQHADSGPDLLGNADDAFDGMYPTGEYWTWAKAGWRNPRAVRYPMGKGALPLFSWWRGKRLTYVQARRKIYVPLYSRAVAKTKSWRDLQKLYRWHNRRHRELWLWDFDGYDHVRAGRDLEQVLASGDRKMGHAFVLAMMLEGIL